MRLNLNNGTLTLLRTCLEQVGWAKGIADIFTGGRLLERLPDSPALPPTKATFGAWVKRGTFSVTLSEKETELCQRCLRHHASAGHLGVDATVLSLCSALKVE